MNNNKMENLGFVPRYPGVTYKDLFGNIQVWEADSWKEASLSWKESCYIHAGISGNEVVIKGPDAQKLLSMASINDVYNWKANRSKHLVMCDDQGLIANHALTQRDNENTFRMFAGNPWPLLKLHKTGKYNAEITMNPIFIFQIAGPLSLTVIEKVTGESQRDVRFLETKKVKIRGSEADVELSRIGMAGTLAYELRGAAQYAPEIYDIVYKAGQEYNMKRLGWKTYTVNHVEGGFPQMTVSFVTSCVLDPEFLSVPEMASVGVQPFTGSVDPADVRARLRTPGEVGWMWMAKFDHDFVGRKALEIEAENPKRTIVNLRWNVEDILDIYASHFQKGEEYKMIEIPSGQPQPAGGHADYVTSLDGRHVGISSATTYSYYYRDLISQCIIDIDQAELGNEVLVHWGDYGKRIKKVRATVVRYPYLDLPRNEEYDLDTVPSGIPKKE